MTFPPNTSDPAEYRTDTGQPAHNFRLTVAYDGTDYFGWQVQPNRPTIQGTLAEAIREVTGDIVLPQGSGRTDTGVHSTGQVVSLRLHAAIPADRLHRALNRRLPAAIRITELVSAPPTFHARTNVLNKTYEYRIFQRRTAGSQEEAICLPHLARFVWDCRWPIHLEAMQQVAAALIGTHDYTSFAATDPDKTTRDKEGNEQPADNTRTIYASAWHQQDGLLLYRVTGSGFLHHMVRNIVGTCVDAGAGRIDPTTVTHILAARDRSKAGATAPPQGLHLMHVLYKEDQA